jgi:ribonuclease P protein component
VQPVLKVIKKERDIKSVLSKGRRVFRRSLTLAFMPPPYPSLVDKEVLHNPASSTHPIDSSDGQVQARMITSQEPELYFIVLAGKKIFRKAVQRNLAKRRLKAMLRLALQDGLHPSCMMTISAKKEVITESFDNLYQQFKSAIVEIVAYTSSLK